VTGESRAPATTITPAPGVQEAAAIVAAIERFARDSAPSTRAAESGGGWLRVGRIEAVSRSPVGPARHPWRERFLPDHG
jgi:hypothetical protein